MRITALLEAMAMSKAKNSRPVCIFCKRSEGVQFAIFNPRFKPFGTACVDCEKTVTDEQAAIVFLSLLA